MSKISANVVINKMNEAVENYNHIKAFNLTVRKGFSVARLVLNTAMVAQKNVFSNPSGVPLLCFVQAASHNKLVIYGIESGKVDIVNASAVSIQKKNLTTFRIKGIRYCLQGTDSKNLTIFRVKGACGNLNGSRFEAQHGTSHLRTKVEEIDF